MFIERYSTNRRIWGFMGKIEENIANNIEKLRKVNNMTQSDLANKLQYSNKTISKWERAESMPEISVLCEIAALFNVSVDFMTKEHNDKEFDKRDKEEKQELLRNVLVEVLWCIASYFIATVVFIYAHLANTSYVDYCWIAFIIAFALCSLIVSLSSRRHGYHIAALVSNSLLIWSSITSVFCITLARSMDNSWMLFLVGLPMQAALFTQFFMKHKIK